MTGDIEIPLAFDTNGDERWWIAGSFSDAVALESVRARYGPDDIDKPTADMVTITRGWWRQRRRTGSDEWIACGPNDRGATAFTLVEL